MFYGVIPIHERRAVGEMRISYVPDLRDPIVQHNTVTHRVATIHRVSIFDTLSRALIDGIGEFHVKHTHQLELFPASPKRWIIAPFIAIPIGPCCATEQAPGLRHSPAVAFSYACFACISVAIRAPQGLHPAPDTHYGQHNPPLPLTLLAPDYRSVVPPTTYWSG